MPPSETGRHLLASARARIAGDYDAYEAHMAWLRLHRPDLEEDVLTARLEEAGQLRLDVA